MARPRVQHRTVSSFSKSQRFLTGGVCKSVSSTDLALVTAAPLGNPFYPQLVFRPSSAYGLLEGQKLRHKRQKGEQTLLPHQIDKSGSALRSRPAHCGLWVLRYHHTFRSSFHSMPQPHVNSPSFAHAERSPVQHTSSHGSPLCCSAQLGLFQVGLWPDPFLTSPLSGETNQVETLLGASAFSICQVFFIFRSLKGSQGDCTGLTLCFQSVFCIRGICL